MEEQWLELKETITEMRDNGGTGTQQEVCQYLINLMNVLEKQIQGSCEDCCDGAQNEKAKLCQKSYLAGMEHYKNLHSCDNAVCRQALQIAARQTTVLRRLYQQKRGNIADPAIWRRVFGPGGF